jgi:hypothetical protein
MNRIKNSLVAAGGLSLLIVLLGVAPAAAGPKNSQVALGTIETDNKFPWVVDVGNGCKGVLIAPRWVLTAAHCIGTNKNGKEVTYERKDPVTGVMTSGSQSTGLNSTFKHPDYRVGFADADIALVRLPKPFDPDPLLQLAELPVAAAAVGQQGTVANLSHTTSLPDGQVAVLRAPVSVVGSKTFFARSTTASLCTSDSGSGFMTLRGGLNVVTGIVSQGERPEDCTTTPNLEFEAVDVFQFLSWISSIAGIGPRDLQPVDAVPADYDGDGTLDLAVKTSAGDWKIDYAHNGFGFWDVVYTGYGFSDAHAVPADYDRDFKADLSVKSDDGMWFIDYASNGFGRWDVAYSGYGFSDAHPVPADYDGDLKADLSVKSDGGVWFIDYAYNGFGRWDVAHSGYGFSDGHPVPADYCVDGRADLSVKSDGGVWFIDCGSNGFGSWDLVFSAFGFSDAHPVPADYDGDGRADLSVKTDDGVWFIDYSVNGFGCLDVVYSGWGDSNARAVPGNYDKDRRVDLAVYSPLNDAWFIDYVKDGFGGLNAVIPEAP